MIRTSRLCLFALALVIQFNSASAQSWLDGFNDSPLIVGDVRDARFGYGDLTALTMLFEYMMGELHDRPAEFVILVDNAAYTRLSELYLQSELLRTRVRIVAQSPESIANQVSGATVTSIPTRPMDYYFHLARRIGIYHTEEGRPPLFYYPSGGSLIPGEQLVVKDSTVRVALPVFSGAEGRLRLEQTQSTNLSGLFGFIQVGFESRLNLAHPGIGTSELGVYPDPIALSLQTLSWNERFQTFIEGIQSLPDANERARLNPLIDLFGSNRYFNRARRGILSGITLDRSERNYSLYYARFLSEIANLAPRPDSPAVVMISPERFPELPEGHRLRQHVRVLSLSDPWPTNINPGDIYVIETGRLPRRTFVTSLSLINGPALISGDGGLSAATLLRVRDIRMIRVAWNEPVVDALPGYRARVEGEAPPVRHLGETLLPMVVRAHLEAQGLSTRPVRASLIREFRNWVIPDLSDIIGIAIGDLCDRFFTRRLTQ